MSTNSCLLQVGNITALVVRKPIKNLHLSVLPPVGKVRVTAPMAMKDDSIRMLIAVKIPWIKRQVKKFENQVRQSPREYVSGESCYHFGTRYRLEVVSEDGPPKVAVMGKTKLLLCVRPKAGQEKREEVMREWYRGELRSAVEEYLPKWQEKLGVKVNHWGIKKMKTRWGTCNHKAGRVWLNLDLAQKPIACMEYVIVHELLHLIERTHTERFTGLLSLHLPKWRGIKDELNRFILSHEDWGY